MSERMERYREMVENALPYALPQPEGCAKVLCEAMRYSLLAGGKRLRPCLTLAAAENVGADLTEALPYACAMEMVHTYSLIHDDLPAMDNDTLRRWRPTNHVVYGEAMAILAGDALLNYAFETAVKAFVLEPEDSLTIGNAIRVLGEKAGIYGMLGGQSVDVENDGKPLEREMLDYIYKNKTSALIEASMMTGAVLAGASEEELEVVEQAAENIGLAFQIQDDILDVTSTQEELGKPIHSDEKNNKVTYVSLMGAPAATGKVKELSEHAVELLNSLDRKNEFLDLLVESLISRRK